MDRFVESVSVFRSSKACYKRAGARVLDCQPPARKGKQEYKDCLIFEEFLELLGTLRSRKFALPAIFVSSNTNDYGKPPGHPRIADDMNRLEGTFCTNLSWALQQIGRTG